MGKCKLTKKPSSARACGKTAVDKTGNPEDE